MEQAQKASSEVRYNKQDNKFKKQRKEKIMLVLGMIFAVVVACVAEVGAISNKLA